MFGGDKNIGGTLIDKMIKDLNTLQMAQNTNLNDGQKLLISDYVRYYNLENNKIQTVITKLKEILESYKRTIEAELNNNNILISEIYNLNEELNKLKKILKDSSLENKSAYLKYLKYKNKYINLKNMIGNGKMGSLGKKGSMSLGSMGSLSKLKGSNMLTNKNVLRPAIEAVMNIPQVKQILKASENPVILNYAIIALIKNPEFKLAIKATKMPFAGDMFKHLLKEKDIIQNLKIAHVALEERKDLQKIAKQIIIHEEIVRIINEPSVNKLIKIAIEQNEDVKEMANIIGFNVSQDVENDEDGEEDEEEDEE
jgi:hypothetical protein